MKLTMKTGLVVLVLLLTISCKKESSTIQSSGIADESLAQALSADAGELAGAQAVRIGTQVWKIKNLTTSHYRNGDRIPEVKRRAKWDSLTTGAWCWYNNDSATYAATYGKLYNWYAVHDPRGLTPNGWHVPSDAEWTRLSTFLGGESVAGGKMKEAGTVHWSSPNTDATNSSGFTGLPDGFRYPDGPFYAAGYQGYWWSSTEYDTINAWACYLYYDLGFIYGYYFDKRHGFSVRCLRD